MTTDQNTKESFVMVGQVVEIANPDQPGKFIRAKVDSAWPGPDGHLRIRLELLGEAA
jgi:hypothetical protein